MGEAVYYLKANNCTPEVLENIRVFILEGVKAQDWWQEHRDMEIHGERKKFWSEFEKKFPLISKYLSTFKGYKEKDVIFGGDCNNGPAGYLDFGDEEDTEHSLEFDPSDGELRYNAMVWHFADWNGFAKFLQTEYGLKNVRWVSDEHMNPFDVL
jgi:hypothetical protein